MSGRTILARTSLMAALAVAGLAPAGLAATPASAAAGGKTAAVDVPAAAAAAQTCTKTRYIYLPDKAHRVVSMSYIECHRTYKGKKQSSTAMWLWDNKDHDGLCATGTVHIGSWVHSWSWCDATKHSPKLTSGWHNGADAKAILVT
jgi:hypothetical protein